ncbi:hypothetical protein KFE98_16815 [bacterium SCSIO 12741]|nr:hypothetical protein KFE98_16815 [bacterium SCSIO 12741]
MPYTKTIGLLLLICAIGALTHLHATTYTSKVAGGDWETNGTWEGGSAPGTTLSNGDSVIISANSPVTFANELSIEGVLLINAGGSLKGYSDNLKIGDGTNTGQCINYGVIHARKVEIKGIDKTPVSGLPLLHNHDTIRTGKVHTGTNSENGTASSGKTINATSGYILISATLGEAKGELHVDGELENCGTIEAETLFKPHGSSVSCCGAIYTPLVEFDLNKDRPGGLGCVNVCSASGSSTQPTWRVKGGSDYATLSAFTDDNGSGSGGFHTDTDFSIDSANTFGCGSSVSGHTWGGLGSYPLPVELVGFHLQFQYAHVLISWTTASETQSDHFIIERQSQNGDWLEIATLDAAGESNESLNYFWQDQDYEIGLNYYRLSEVDINGEVTTFPISSIRVKENISSRDIQLYPNPNYGSFHVKGDLEGLKSVIGLDAEGKQHKPYYRGDNQEIFVVLESPQGGTFEIVLVFPNETKTLSVVVTSDH